MTTPSLQPLTSKESRSKNGVSDLPTGLLAAFHCLVRAFFLGSWIVGSLGVVVVGVFAQDPPKIKPSQHGSVSQRVADTTITVEYNRPVARGRELFGKLVPYGRIWCPCADDATTVEVSTGVTVEGKDLPAGRYSLWTEPEPERWTVIFNKNAGAWHTRYPEGQDALQVQVTPRTGSHMETMAFYFPVVDGKTAELALHWGTIVVPLKIEVP